MITKGIDIFLVLLIVEFYSSVDLGGWSNQFQEPEEKVLPQETHEEK
jgi:hypothetical protein